MPGIASDKQRKNLTLPRRLWAKLYGELAQAQKQQGRTITISDVAEVMLWRGLEAQPKPRKRLT